MITPPFRAPVRGPDHPWKGCNERHGGTVPWGSVQAAPLAHRAGPLVMRRWLVFEWRLRPSLWPRTGAPRRYQSSLGYGAIRRPSHLSQEVSSLGVDLGRLAGRSRLVSLRLLRFRLSRRDGCTNLCTNLVPELRVSTVPNLRDHTLSWVAAGDGNARGPIARVVERLGFESGSGLKWPRFTSGAPDPGDGIKLILTSARLNNQKPYAAVICCKADLRSCGGRVDGTDQVR